MKLSGHIKKLSPLYKNRTCPACGTPLRFPVKPGKTLLITCTNCQHKFEIRFYNPVRELFHWQKNQPFGKNLKDFLFRFRALPFNTKLSLIILAISFAMTLYFTSKTIQSVLHIRQTAPIQAQKTLAPKGIQP